MISGFFNIVQQDIKTIGNHIQNQENANAEQQQKVSVAALRMFAVLGMALSVVIGVGVFTATTAMGALLRLAAAIVLYVVSHDIFVIARNSEKGMLDQVVALGHGLFNDLKDLWNGNKNSDDALRHPFTEGTFLRPLWDTAFDTKE